ncbi:MAG: TPM domain-containing protein [Kofleriaceae bacterium]
MTRRGTIDRSRVSDAVQAANLRTSADVVVAIAPFFIGSVERAAERAFTQLGVTRTGALVFVVPARRQVIILSDEGTRACIATTIWSDLASQIAAAFSRAEGTRGLIDAVELLASALSVAFPHERAADVAND